MTHYLDQTLLSRKILRVQLGHEKIIPDCTLCRFYYSIIMAFWKLLGLAFFYLNLVLLQIRILMRAHLDLLTIIYRFKIASGVIWGY